MELNYKKIGSGEPLIILHGLFGSLDNWMTLGKELANKYCVYLVDQRNHGSSPHDYVFNYQAMANDLKEFIAFHKIENPSVLGHSMGGKTAMTFALENTNVWNKLIVVDIAPRAYPVHHQEIIKALNDLPVTELTSRGEADERLKIEDSGQRLFLLKNLKRLKEGGFGWKMNLPVIEKNIEEVGDGIEPQLATEKDVLFIKGEKSDYINNEDSILIYQLFPNADIKTIKDAGHWVHADKPQELLNLVTDFLRG